MKEKKRVAVVVGVIFNRDGRVLLSTRPSDKSYPGFWEFVGGKIEAGETPFAALRREVGEELNLSILRATPWLKKEIVCHNISLHLSFWRVDCGDWEGEVKALEGQRWQWVRPDALTQKNLLPASCSFAAALVIPRQLYLRDGSLADAAGKFLILPMDSATSESQRVYLLFNEFEKLKEPADFAWFAVVVQNRAEMNAALGTAEALIWTITSSASFAELKAVLEAGATIPILAMGFSAPQKEALLELGIHGLIDAA